MTLKLATKLVVAVLWIALPIVFSRRTVKLERVSSSESRTVNYFTAGIANQPEGAFDFIMDHPALTGDNMVLVPYQNDGLSYREICREIEQDILDHQYTKVRFFGISLGTKIGHYFAQNRAVKQVNAAASGEIDFKQVEIECYDINPCWSPQFLKSGVRTGLQIGVVPLTGIELALGPISLIPFINQSDEWFSPRISMSQLRRIAYAPPEFWLNDKPGNRYLDTRWDVGNHANINSVVKAVVISDDDEFLDNSAIMQYYGNDTDNIVRIQTGHGDTIGSGEIYRTALDPFLQKEGEDR